MNPIALWCNIEDYGDWCYQYRIPSKEEFIPGFKYDFREYTYCDGKKHNPTIYRVVWNEYTVGNNKDHKHVEKFLHQYLEAGYIRVKKADERLEVNNNQSIQMKLFYYKIGERWTLERDPNTNEIKKYIHDHETDSDIKYIVIKAENEMKGYTTILEKYRTVIPNSKQDHELLQLKEKEAYRVDSFGEEFTKEIADKLNCSINEIFVDPEAMHDFGNIAFKDNKSKPVAIQKSKVTKNGWDLFKKFFQRTTKVVSEHITVVDIKSKYPSRRDPVTGRWRPVEKPEIHQPEKSPNALVCIATKDRKEFKRIARKDASEIISTQLADEKEWEYISKEEYRALTVTFKAKNPKTGKLEKVTKLRKPGLSFTPHNMDKRYKIIPVEVEYVEQEMIRNSYRDEKTGKMVYLPITYKDTDKTFTKWENQFYYDEGADNQYHYYKKDIPNKSSSKVASKSKRKKNKKTHIKVLPKQSTYTQPLYDYEVSIIRNYKEGTTEAVYKIQAKSEGSAKYKAFKRADKEGLDPKHFRADVKLLTEIVSKKEKISQVKKTIMPQVIDLPVWKDRLGNIIPWFKRVTKITTEEERAKGAGIFKEDKEEVKTYTKYEVVYHRLDKSPFKEEVNLETSSVN